jgi:hypothetical protein
MKSASVIDPQVDRIRGRVTTGAGEPDDRVRRVSWMVEHLNRRRWPLVMMLALAIVSMAYSLWWNPAVHHSHTWMIPGDIWSTFRAAHWVGWGDIGAIYGKDTQLVTFPGIAVLLAPVAMVSGALGLGESIVPVILSRPTSWLLLGPAILLLGSTCLMAFDAMAEELGVNGPRRIVLSFMEAVVIFQVVTLWGHPEDLLALTFSLYALLAMFGNRWSLSGWLWGAAIVTQPLVILMFPLAFVRTPTPQRLRLCLYGALPSLALLSAPLVMQWHRTSTVLFHQENARFLDHATPWIALSPTLSRTEVGAGPGRMIAVLMAVVIGFMAYQRPPSRVGLLWLCALALSLRCFFESVMDVFYLGPPLALIVLTAATCASRRRLVGAWAVAILATVYGFHRASEWGYWAPMVAFLAIGLACAWPGRAAVGLFGDGSTIDLATMDCLTEPDGRVIPTAVRRCACAPGAPLWPWPAWPGRRPPRCGSPPGR